MSRDQGTGAVRTWSAAAVCVLLLVCGLALTVAAHDAPLSLDLPTVVLPLVLLAAFLFTMRVTLDFEVRGHNHAVTLGQLPLALGVLFVEPVLHAGACISAVALTALARRHHPFKTAYNVGAAAVEVGVPAFAVSLVAGSDTPTTALWLTLFAGLVLGDAVNSLSLSAVWRLLGMPVTGAQVVQPLVLGALTTFAASGTAVVAVSAAYTEPASIGIVLLIAAGLAYAYRRYRQLRQQQQTTQDLYSFVRDLGPVDVEQDGVQDVLEQVRLLLHAEELELLVAGRAAPWYRLTAREGEEPHRRVAEAPRNGHARRVQDRSGSGFQTMTTTLLGADGLMGVLTARSRLGDARDFDLGDVRLLETVGGELATALERGTLLAHLQRTATTDQLTGLPNLPETTRLLDELLQRSPAVLLAAVSVDSFRDVNETLGHGVGDGLLLETTRRLTRAYPSALVGRIGGARFAVALPDDGTSDAMLVGLNLRAVIEGEARTGPVGTLIRLAVGVAQAPEHGLDGQTLLRRAETAMSSARAAHGGPVAWAPAYEVQGQRRLAVVSALREAVATGAIGLAYQPKLETRTGRVTGVEALARWTHPALGAVSPDEFIPLAEASGFIGALTSTVLRQAATAARGWQRRAAGVGVAVNVSADTVLDPAFVTEVASILTSTGLEPHLLTLELTEGVVVADTTLAVERLSELRSLGVRIAVDDFGTGYSSLSYLKGLPVDEVKIDKSFVRGLGEDAADEAVVRAAVDIAHTLGLRVVAEGVEEVRQDDAVTLLGVDEVQGYLHGRPMATAAIGPWLRNRAASALG